LTDINARERPGFGRAYRVDDSGDVIFNELPVGCRERDDRNPAVLYVLFVFKGFVACDQDIESGCLGRLQELAVLQPGEDTDFDFRLVEPA
jgi:hypothetical protein